MSRDLLKDFYLDKHLKECVRDFLVLYLKEKAVDLTFSGNETKHIKLAREVIDEAWNKLELLYGKKKIENKGNPAR